MIKLQNNSGILCALCGKAFIWAYWLGNRWICFECLEVHDEPQNPTVGDAPMSIL